VAWPDEVAIGDFSTETEAWRAQADYSRALTSRTRLMFGYLGYNRVERQDNELDVVPGTAARARAMAMPSTHAAYRYEETVQSLFGMVAQSLGKFSAQLGVRAEVAATEFALPITKETFDKDYNSLYPNVSLSYAFAQTRSLRLAYSRRITRPVPMYMNPSVAQLDPLNRTWR
jgi:outer membrane receptor protein involved in Fe transport